MNQKGSFQLITFKSCLIFGRVGHCIVLLFPLQIRNRLSDHLNIAVHRRLDYFSQCLLRCQHVPGGGRPQNADDNADEPQNVVAPFHPEKEQSTI